MAIDVQAFLASLAFLVEGWLGIFVVMGIIIACIYGLNRFSERLEEKAGKTGE